VDLVAKHQARGEFDPPTPVPPTRVAGRTVAGSRRKVSIRCSVTVPMPCRTSGG